MHQPPFAQPTSVVDLSALPSQGKLKQQYKNSEFHLTPLEISQLINGARSIRDRLVIALLAYTGIRRSELRSLRPDDLDLVNGDILIRYGKGGKQRLVFAPSALQEMLRHQLDFSTPCALLPGPSGAPLSLRSLNFIVANCGRRAGLRNPNPRYRNITPHLLRHSMARNWKRAGGSLESLQKILGHASMKTTLDLYGTEAVSETRENYFTLADRLVPVDRLVVR